MTQRTTSDNVAPVVQVGRPMRRAELDEKLAEKLPNLREHIDRVAPDRDPNKLVGQVFIRPRATELIAEHPEIDGPVQLDCMWADVMAPSFVDEILKAWPEATFFNLNEDAADSVRVVKERRDATS